MKSLVKSKTFWIAVVQALVGGAIIFLESGAIPDAVGYVAIVKSIGDIVLRLVTTDPIRSIT